MPIRRFPVPLLLLVLAAAPPALAAPTVVADFESGDALRRVRSWKTSATRVPDEPGHALRWRVRPTGETVALEIGGVPRDIRRVRRLRFRVRSEGSVRDELQVRFRAGRAALAAKLGPVGAEWRTVELLLPEMRVIAGPFDPRRTESIRFVSFGARGFTLRVDDVALETGGGGWRWTEREILARVFGEERLAAVRTIETDHFRIHTDSAAAGREFPAALEEMHDFICDALSLEADGVGRIPAYVFGSDARYHDFCVRRGWPRAFAKATAGHASRDYFATFCQSPRSPVLVHEMTHSVLQRALGEGGGSWFQEGAAVYVEERWRGRSPAARFAADLRAGRFVPLRRFLARERLIDGPDAAGGAATAAGRAMYLQAGAFFEFLRRGPPAERRPDALFHLAQIREEGAGRRAAVVEVLGRSVAELEKSWFLWGSRPPDPAE